ncbi:peptidase S45 [Variovorax sp. WS11]|nr:penicillin acylase family protein [Variovorax sp. WS11]PSL80104.1 peptidase S45 [Variovorax sp. WS11]
MAAALVVPACARAARSSSVEIRRTTDGIPHVRAGSWRGLGIGYGYAQAEDALCTLADGFVTYRGQRSYYFGGDQRPAMPATFGRPTNLELDFFFRAFADERAVEAFRREQPEELNELIAGFAEGYNRYVRTLSRRTGRQAPACGGASWVHAIDATDIVRRLIAAGLAAGAARFVPEIVNARPAAAAATAPAVRDALSSRLASPVGEIRGLGSNMLAFGRQATGGQGGLLFGNPHWYWGGSDRFYQAHLTLPGRLDVAGVAFLGVPVIMIGFNDHVAWSHTVSAARRFGLFELALDPQDPTRYRVDGVFESMEARSLAVEAQRPDGSVETVRRTLYRTRFGPVIDFGRHDAAFGWGTARALAMRDVNAENPRVFRNFLRWNQAKSLDEFIAIQRQEGGMPWVNTSAIGAGDGRAWYADIGAVPDVPDAQRATCMAPLSKAFAALDPRTPLLDGSRSACQWRIDPGAAQAGAMATAGMPSLLREDYVANMNDSYWLTQPALPLEGYPSILGGEREPLTLRGREGHRIAAALMARPAASAEELAGRLKREVLSARAYSADQFKDVLLGAACTPAATGLHAPCRVLRAWSNRAEPQARGALLWDAFWARLNKIPAAEFYTTPFSGEEPLQTPRAPNAADARVAHALAQAVEDLAARGVALDAPLGSERFARSGGRRVPLPGGCDEAGYFAIACSTDGSYALGPQSHANSYLQVVYFDDRGVQASTLLAHGERDTAVLGGAGSAPVLRYARGDWLRFPFHARDIERDPGLRRLTLRY